MNPIDYVIIAIVVAVIGGAAFYIFKAKKSGQKCIGCPYSKTCGSKCAGCQGNCGSEGDCKENK
jgi:hypothetical protein